MAEEMLQHGEIKNGTSKPQIATDFNKFFNQRYGYKAIIYNYISFL